MLDAAFGTGRHAEYLLDRGHRVIAVDGTSGMLDRARAKLPTADLRLGDLEALPLEDQSVDLAMCALALTHHPELGPALTEFAGWCALAAASSSLMSHPQFLALGGGAFEVRGKDAAQ